MTTPVGIAEDAIVLGKTGYITSEFAAVPLAEAIVKLTALDPTARAAMSAEAQSAARRFSPERMAERTKSLYAEKEPIARRAK